MPVFYLNEELVFPPAELAEEEGLLAVGGDLSVERLLLAYSQGIFPWFSEENPILWWAPDPRLVLFPDEFKISRSLKQTIKKGVYDVTVNKAFPEVIAACAKTKRQGEKGTWITHEMIEAYTELHRLGYAHSIESWHNGKLVGGLYGVSLGSIFFGESMFSQMSDASKTAFAFLVERLKKSGCKLIDCQISTAHLISLGAREISRNEFMRLLSAAVS
ncbi:MAG: leucyl/phenylalanyl-tRNA--protein transferase [Nitrospirae bacterium]|nr:leucyl/phenylalanyl-tRNA--protein transferase [Nitrospirota bacterium]